jgi:hypothetical protein
MYPTQGVPAWGQAPQGQAPQGQAQQAAPPAAPAPAAAASIDDPVEAAIRTYNTSKNTLNRLRSAFGPEDDADLGKDSGEAASAALSPEATAVVVVKPEFYDTGAWKFPFDKDGKPMTGFKDGFSTIGANLDKLPVLGALFLDGAQKMLDIVDRRGARLREETELLEKQVRLRQVMQQLPPKQQQQQQATPAPAPKPAFSGFPAVEEIPRPPRNN